MTSIGPHLSGRAADVSGFPDRTCKKCGQTLPASRFSPRHGALGVGFRGECTPCRHKAYNEEYRRRQDRMSPSERAMFVAEARRRSEEYREREPHWSKAWKSMNHGAKSRGLSIDFTKESFREWWASTPDVCEYCGIDARSAYLRDEEIRRISKVTKSRVVRGFARLIPADVRRLTVDRKDSDCGYSLNNVVKCCSLCNTARGSVLSHESFRIVGPLLREDAYRAIESTKLKESE